MGCAPLSRQACHRVPSVCRRACQKTAWPGIRFCQRKGLAITERRVLPGDRFTAPSLLSLSTFRPAMSKIKKSLPIELGDSTADKITVRGGDLPSEILGHFNLGDMAFLELTGRAPTPQQSVTFNAILVTLVEHGITPSALVARLTYAGAPESLQAAVAAGLCGLGSVFVGSTGGAARMLYQAIAAGSAPTQAPDVLARAIVADHRSRKEIVPGLGHPLHKPIDPRTPRLFQIAAENGLSGPHVGLMQGGGAHRRAEGCGPGGAPPAEKADRPAHAAPVPDRGRERPVGPLCGADAGGAVRGRARVGQVFADQCHRRHRRDCLRVRLSVAHHPWPGRDGARGRPGGPYPGGDRRPDGRRDLAARRARGGRPAPGWVSRPGPQAPKSP